MRVRQLQRFSKDHQVVLEMLDATWLDDTSYFHRTHKLKPTTIKVGDWVLLFDSSLEHQHSPTKEFA